MMSPEFECEFEWEFEWGGAYLGADMECWHPDFEGEPGTTYPTIWYNEEFYDGDREFDELDWDETTLHELCHYCGVPDPIEPGSEYVTNFYNPYAIMVLVKVNLWGTKAWEEMRAHYQCVVKKTCTCGPTTRDPNCPKHGRG